MAGKIDQVLVVPTEPLAMLAATPPRPGLIDSETVRLANIAPWRLHVFNQLVQQLTDFNTQHAVEIRSERTDDQRRTELTDAAAGHSALIHADGIGMAWSDGQGWFRTLAAALGEDMLRLDRAARRRW